jgi:hypothetical protein
MGQPGFPQQPPPGYGQPPQGMGMPGMAPGAPQGMAPYGQAPMAQPGVMGTLPSAGVGGSSPTRRNALMTFLLPFGIIFGSVIVGNIIAFAVSIAVGMLLMLVGLIAGSVIGLLNTIKMINELKSVTRNAALAWWPILIPIYNIIFMWFTVPAEVTKAKQMMGTQAPPRSLVVYIFLWPFALASDLNDMVR